MNIASVLPTQFLQSLPQRRDLSLCRQIGRGIPHQNTDAPHSVGLRKGGEWPYSRQSSSPCDKIASSHGWPPFGLRVGSSKHDFAAHNMRRNGPFAPQNA